MKYNIILVTLLAIVGLSGCGYKEGVATAEQKSYLYFTGNVSDIKVSVDNGATFKVESGINHQYKINSGKHTITIYRENNVILKREIYVSDSIAKEIEVQQ
ncbi:MAG: hypothetical protein WC680_02235 [Sulfuricurvum sp.]|jgi:hypothetical protein